MSVAVCDAAGGVMDDAGPGAVAGGADCWARAIARSRSVPPSAGSGWGSAASSMGKSIVMSSSAEVPAALVTAVLTAVLTVVLTVVPMGMTDLMVKGGAP